MPKKKTWSGRFSEPVDELVQRFTASVSFDRRLAKAVAKGAPDSGVDVGVAARVAHGKHVVRHVGGDGRRDRRRRIEVEDHAPRDGGGHPEAEDHPRDRISANAVKGIHVPVVA